MVRCDPIWNSSALSLQRLTPSKLQIPIHPHEHPPTYQSIIDWILSDPPPDYFQTTGVKVIFDEVNIY